MAREKIEVGLDEFLLQLRATIANASRVRGAVGENLLILSEAQADWIVTSCDKFLEGTSPVGAGAPPKLD